MESPKDFANFLKDEPTVYALVLYRLINLSVQIGSISTPASLPSEYNNYVNVFSIEEAGRLPQYKASDHIIELEGGELLYGPLYNLLGSELKVLREYLNNILVKGWIQYSVSFIRVSVLFIFKKDGGLYLCVDYRRLNKVIIKNQHPLSLISEMLN